MRLLWLILSLAFVVACSSSSSTRANSEASDQSESPYARSLPATDMGASREASNNHSSTEDKAASNDQPAYAREFVLEEEVIASATGEVESYSESAAELPSSTAGQIDIANTFTLQLAAVSSMDIAIGYAQQYGIDPSRAGVARILSQGQIFYVLAYGVYSSYEEAERASLEIQAKGVPEPWIRRLSALEKLSNEANASGL